MTTRSYQPESRIIVSAALSIGIMTILTMIAAYSRAKGLG